LGKPFVDADEELVNTYGMDIPAIFAVEGEEGFREKETAVLEALGKRAGLVIATGGGCVTREENYPLLHQNGNLFWLTRDLEKLPSDGRPLSQATKMADMYRVRKPLYESFSDFTISNDRPPEAAAAEILAKWEESK
jgi:shikimate dehydrogenase